MIRIISGVYGHYIGNRVVPKDSSSEPFELTPEQEARLVNLGVAEYISDAPIGFDEIPDGVVGIPEYDEHTKASDLREIGKLCGLSFKVGMSKKDMLAALDEYIRENTVDGVDEEDIVTDETPDNAAVFDAADAVVG